MQPSKENIDPPIRSIEHAPSDIADGPRGEQGSGANKVELVTKVRLSKRLRHTTHRCQMDDRFRFVFCQCGFDRDTLGHVDFAIGAR